MVKLGQGGKVVMEEGTEARHPEEKSPRKARKRKPELWIRNVRKAKVNSGKAYQQVRKDGKVDQAKSKEIGEPCKCKKKCHENLTNEERSRIFETYWEMGDREVQRGFLVKWVKRQQKIRERKRTNIGGERRMRDYNYKYFLPDPNDANEAIEVCQKFFLGTINVSKKVIATVFQKKLQSTGTMKKDLRGRKTREITTGNRQRKVVQHIKMFKVVESHYVRKTSKAQYLPQELSLAEMYRLSQNWCHENKYRCENYDSYRRVFSTRFNLKFQRPKKDLCSPRMSVQ